RRPPSTGLAFRTTTTCAFRMRHKARSVRRKTRSKRSATAPFRSTPCCPAEPGRWAPPTGAARFTEKLNTPVQGTGADGLKLALALLWERRGQCPVAFPVLAGDRQIALGAAAHEDS